MAEVAQHAGDTCAHCGLRVPLHRQAADAAPAFCCVGCRIVYDLGRAAATDRELQQGAPVNTLLLRLLLGGFLSMNLMAFQGFFYSQHVYEPVIVPGQEMQFQLLHSLLAYVQMTLCTLVVTMLGTPLLLDSWDRLRQSGLRSTDANSLILLGVLASYGLSVINTLRGEGPLYYDTAAMILVLVTLGAYLDSRGKRSAMASGDSLLESLPRTVTVLRNGAEEELPATDLVTGDEVRISPGQAAAVDGIVLRGRSHVVESTLTGESNPRTVEPGSRMLAGALNVDGVIWVRATSVGEKRVLAQLRNLLREARLRQPRIQHVADRVSAWFVPFVVLLAVALFAWHASRGEVIAGMMTALSVLLISCPCALGLAAPLASWNGLARAASAGILFRSAQALERAAGVRTVIFDKTGTLTTLLPELGEIACDESLSQEQALQLAASVEATSPHPLARAMLSIAAARQITLLPTEQATVIPGRGYRATIGGQDWLVGSEALMSEMGLVIPPTLRAHHTDEPGTRVYLASASRVLAALRFRESLRQGARDAVQSLKARGFRLRMLSGDRPEAASAIASALGIKARAGLLPAQKLERLQRLRKRSKKPIAFVGDGANDAPVMAGADVGIAVSSALDITRQAGQIQLMGDSLEQLPLALAIARDTQQRIRLNLFWCFGYNAIGITLAALGLLSPIFAASTMVVSSLLIVMTSRSAGQVPGTTPAEAAGVSPAQASKPLTRASERLVPAKAGGVA